MNKTYCICLDHMDDEFPWFVISRDENGDEEHHGVLETVTDTDASDDEVVKAFWTENGWANESYQVEVVR